MSEKFVFLTKPDCKLCEDAKGLLEAYRLLYKFHYEEKNIEEDDELHQAYLVKIPVVKCGDDEIDVNGINAETLDQFLLNHKDCF